MNNFLDTNRLHHLLGWTLLGLLILLLTLEGWRYGVKPSEANNEQVIETSLSNAANYFQSKQEELQDRSEDLAATLSTGLLQQRSSQSLYNTFSSFPDFWSISLYQRNRPVVWRGFAMQDRNNNSSQSTYGQDTQVNLKKHSNIAYWECFVPFSVQDSAGTTSYRLFTTYRIEQSNLLAIGGSNEFDIFRSEEFSSDYPLNFSIFSSPPSNYVQAQQLSNLEGDSVGVVYATADEFQQTKAQWEQNTRFWRSVFALFCFVMLVLLLFKATDRLSAWSGLGLQLLFLGVGWGIFAYTNMPSYWVLEMSDSSSNEWINSVESLSATTTNAIFVLLASICIAHKLNLYNQKIEANWYLSSMAIAGMTGLINALSIPVVFDLILTATKASSVSLLDLRIFPSWGTIILYLAIGMSLLAMGIILVALNRLLFRITDDQFKLTASVLAILFIIGLFIAQLFIPSSMVFNWIFYTSIISFAIIFGISVGYFREFIWVTSLSPLRKIVLGSLIISIAGIPIIYQASLSNTDNELWENALNFNQEEDPFASKLTNELLTTLEKGFLEITQNDLENNRSTLQARFTQTIQQFLSPEWNSYSFDLQLVDSTGALIADYTTDLNSPDWLNIYNIPTIKSTTEMQQITKSTIRPIVQHPQLRNQEDYRIFYRGWIPVFGTSDDTPIAWILCSIYQERPEFNKPIRAVMASLTYEDWNTSYLMQKFENGKLLSSAQQGFTGYFPKHQALSNETLRALEEDSLIYVTDQSSDYSYRTLFWKESDNRTIKISTTLADYRVILFSFFRFSFTLLLAGFLFVGLAQLVTWGDIQFMGKNKRFQDRILDSFLLAILIFLAFLIATSHYAIKQQNQGIVRQELFDKLESLSEVIEANPAIRNNQQVGPAFSLETLTTPLNVDASFYTGTRTGNGWTLPRTVTETTTPQIYQQHLLPAVLPYEIYNRLFIQGQQDAYSSVNLAGQSLLIGYRAIYNAENRPVATIAIPTFLESPKYDQQLLETTSYLILIYLLVFGLFIIGSTFISKQLTRPLVYIQRGLNKISSGNLDTKIPVTSEDEIGNLAEAYNNMVFRLKTLQKELAAAEREAAWKEMAQQVAHEIKNPLTPMKLNVQHLERQLKSENSDPAELKKSIQKITSNLIEQIQSLNNIASDFSKFSQPIDENFTKVELSAILSSVAELYHHDEKVEVNFYSQNSSVYVQGVADELKRVIINLVKNAYEAMPDGGGEINIQLYKQQQDIFVEVEDNGSGIPEDDRPNIFVPNFSTKSSGTGLGLAICKKIIEAHEGSISFASVEGEGTTFVIKLPGS